MRFLKALRSRENGYRDNGYSSLATSAAEDLAPAETPRREIGRVHVFEKPSISTFLAKRVKGVSKGSSDLNSDNEEEDGVTLPRSYSEFSCRIDIDSIAGSQSFDDKILRLQSFVSDPPPPKQLWDTDDTQYLEKVTCRCRVRLTHIDPKNGAFEGRLRCKWYFRTLKMKDRTEPRMRVPGIRIPTLVTNVEESRIWRHFEADSAKTIAWQGTSSIRFSGFELFQVKDFPFDRQVIDLHLFEFVWRVDKDADTYHEDMRIVSLDMSTSSMLPEWDTYPTVMEPCEILHAGSGPTYAARFLVTVRLQRKSSYYITHIFMVSLLITVAAILPLAIEPGDTHIGDRVLLHSSGLLTLVAFKYVASKELPSVPYPTFIDNFMDYQVWTLAAVSGEAIFSYRTVGTYLEKSFVEALEILLLIALLCVWSLYFGYVVYGKERQTWGEVMRKHGFD